MAVPPYQRIAAEIAARIAAGDLAPGDRIASTRQLTAQYGIAMATATKVIATLREQGLVRALPGVGTVVAAPARPADAAPDRDRVVRAAVTIADAEGLAALSMRRLAAEIGVPTMSLYRYVADKEELLLLMTDSIFAVNPPPPLTAEDDGWRRCVEAIARQQWAIYRRHPWLAQAMSFTRPLLAPHAMAYTEWTMRALDRHGLSANTQFRAAVMVANYVRGTAVNLEHEAQAEQETGMTGDQWLQARQARFEAVLATGRLPMMARYLAADDRDFNLDTLVEFGLQRLLSGLAEVLEP
ncbi:TetR/AcrR family transcriptional regulator C-terminal domain-containing protein [Amorphoplanes digitatis]|uniref:DNA-binding transcriptional regulator YhcF (GntR family) n=1 Tax=Actinoplanes digitatis TaxID=1868 RepID=A0A7W7MQ74_9ACTN|nr:TetR/AcrR family transcriptional regulator C-terminal domain-containing protein [Actinoplanes digitatis]MBB4762290.1 DNA-binding transcriptional regulator YhcF (GntR family) [Actinoplanes digitatis]BFE71091.1 TetR/AcrR family transcriptional regulator C-terminal domain-containing protein [Actinoplanes digitatis]GID92588.1 GntR family transcriptional regulator [Actinoplanes digitatis]